MTANVDTSLLDSMPTLPAGVSKGGACLWAASVLARAGVERGWSADDLSTVLIGLATLHAANTHDDEQVIDLVQQALDYRRSLKAQKS